MKKLISVLLCCICCSCLGGCGEKPDLVLDGAEVSAAAEQELSSANEDDPEKETSIFVYVCGAVAKPGVYEMEPDSRIYQLVEMAGGMSGNADAKSVNLAETLSDGEMIWIPEDTGTEAGTAEEKQDVPAGMSSDGKININTASEEQLMTLPGIGETKARQIIAYRESSGAFRDIKDIMKVEGIKEGTYQKLKDSIAVQ